MGSFMIYGKKNFITPSRLEMGFGLMWKLEEESISSHLNERKRRDGADDENEETEVFEDVVDDSNANEATGDNNTETPIDQDEKKNDVDQNDVDQNDDSDSNQAAEGSQGDDIDETQSKITMTTNTINQLVIDKNTEYSIVKDIISTKKNTKQSKNTGSKKSKPKGNKKGEPAPAPVEEAKIVGNKPQKHDKNKKRRIQKMKDKYGELTEEENEIQMALLGAKKFKAEIKKPNKNDKLGNKKAQDASNDEEMIEDDQKQDFKKKKNANKSQGKGNNKNKDKEANQKTSANPKTENAVEKKPASQDDGNDDGSQEGDAKPEENLEEIEEETEEMIENKKETMSVMNTIIDEETEKILNDALEFKDLTGIPKPDDLLLEAIPVCAPYNSMVNYKYRVKVVPGTLKKGKAARQAMHVFEINKDSSKIEKGLIKGIDEAYAIQQILGNSKVQGPGVQKLKMSEKDKKKAAKKNKDKN